MATAAPSALNPGGKTGFDPYRYLAGNPAAAALVGMGQTTSYDHWDKAGRPLLSAPQPAAAPQPGAPAAAVQGSPAAMPPADAWRWMAAAANPGKAQRRRSAAAGLLTPPEPAASPMGSAARQSAARLLLLGSDGP